MTININELSIMQRMAWLQHAIAPRPICFASTIDKEENVNLSPFSFFNLFSSNPPVVIFSPARRGRDNTTKHTLEKLKRTLIFIFCIVNKINNMLKVTFCIFSFSFHIFWKGKDRFLLKKKEIKITEQRCLVRTKSMSLS